MVMKNPILCNQIEHPSDSGQIVSEFPLHWGGGGRGDGCMAIRVEWVVVGNEKR